MSVDLTTEYLGFDLATPLVASASPLSDSVDGVRKLEDAGVSAVVLPSLFEESIERESLDLERYLRRGTESYAESLSYLPHMPAYRTGPESYLELVGDAVESVDIPVIASLNGVSPGGWVKYAKLIEQAGASALELNLYVVPTDPEVSGADVEGRIVALVNQVRRSVELPLAVKLQPFFSALPHAARRFEEAGADALVLFNRFYEPDFDLDELDVVPRLKLSTSHELLTRLHAVAILYSSVRADLAVTGGVHTGTDVIKSMMAGARVAMMTSALLHHGLEHAQKVRDEVVGWMEEREYASIKQMQGSMSMQHVEDPAAFERVNYMRVLRSYALHEPL